MDPQTVERKLAAILSADVAGYSRLMAEGQTASSALEELFGVYPGFTTEKLIEELQKWNTPDDRIRRWVAALRKAGLKE